MATPKIHFCSPKKYRRDNIPATPRINISIASHHKQQEEPPNETNAHKGRRYSLSLTHTHIHIDIHQLGFLNLMHVSVIIIKFKIHHKRREIILRSNAVAILGAIFHFRYFCKEFLPTSYTLSLSLVMFETHNCEMRIM